MTPAARERLRVRVPLLLASAAAWALLLHQELDGTSGHHSHAAHGRLQSGSPHVLLAAQLPTALAAEWMLMLAAMMLPLLTQPVHHLRTRTFRHRRLRSTTLFLTGYAAVWLIVGMALLPLSQAVQVLLGESLAGWAGLLVAVGWQCTPNKQQSLNRMHACPPLSAFGWRRDGDALRFGASHGLWCVGSCWALMALPLLLPSGHLVAMAVVGLWLAAERVNRPVPPSWRLRCPRRAAGIAVAHMRMLQQPNEAAVRPGVIPH